MQEEQGWQRKAGVNYFCRVRHRAAISVPLWDVCLSMRAITLKLSQGSNDCALFTRRPIIARLHIDFERDRKRQHVAHFVADEFSQVVDLVGR